MNLNGDEVDQTTNENTIKIPTEETDSEIIVDEILEPESKTNNSLPFTAPDPEVIEEPSNRISEQEEEDEENDDNGRPGMYTSWLSPKVVSSTVKLILIIFGVFAIWVCVYWSTEILCCTDFRKRKSQINQRV